MTALGGLGHTLPYLIPHFEIATVVAILVVIVELGVIAWIRRHFMATPWTSAIFLKRRRALPRPHGGRTPSESSLMRSTDSLRAKPLPHH